MKFAPDKLKLLRKALTNPNQEKRKKHYSGQKISKLSEKKAERIELLFFQGDRETRRDSLKKLRDIIHIELKPPESLIIVPFHDEQIFLGLELRVSPNNDEHIAFYDNLSQRLPDLCKRIGLPYLTTKP